MSEDAHLSGEVCGRMRNHETRVPKLCYFDAYHDKELPNGIRKFNLDAPICVVRLILSHGIDYVLIALTRCPYLKQEDTSTGYFPQGACPVGGGTAWPCANPSPQLRLGLQSLWRRGPRLRTCHMEPRAQTVVMWNDSFPCMAQSLVTLLDGCAETGPCQPTETSQAPDLNKPPFYSLVASHFICSLASSPRVTLELDSDFLC